MDGIFRVVAPRTDYLAGGIVQQQQVAGHRGQSGETWEGSGGQNRIVVRLQGGDHIVRWRGGEFGPSPVGAADVDAVAREI